ncbi:MAG: hypothetical protein LAN62_08695 [Acidobacteriia bacterium]|nr:hypothetical protein [Terriglobia bacterium]
MEIPRKAARHTETLRTFKRLIKEMKDAKAKLTSECMLILISALEVGANVDRLVEHTGYSRELIEAISGRMRKAGLWIGEWVDDIGWWDQKGNLTSEFYAQTQVAIGRSLREWTQAGRFRYVDAATGEVVRDWSPLDDAEVRRSIRTLRN